MDFGSIIWFALLLVAWTLVGLVVAYWFGGWARHGEASERIVVASKVRYLRRKKHANAFHRTSTETRPRRVAGGRVRH